MIFEWKVLNASHSISSKYELGTNNGKFTVYNINVILIPTCKILVNQIYQCFSLNCNNIPSNTINILLRSKFLFDKFQKVGNSISLVYSASVGG